MSPDVEIEKDPFLILLTDALRAGPGSPQWHEAVTHLKAAGQEVDEYRLLVEAREALESGKDYRSVRAGAGFTRKLMTGLGREEQAGSGARRISTPGLIAIIAGLVILAVIGVVAYELYPRGTGAPDQHAVEELAATYFPNEILTATFDDTIPMTWRKIGTLSLETDGGLRPGAQMVQSGSYVGGGVVAADPIPAQQPFSFQVTFRLDNPSDDLIPQAFVANDQNFSQDHATSAQELVWQVRGRQQSVVVGGNVQHQSPLPARGRTVVVRFLVNRDATIVETNGQRLWAGPNGLGPNARYVGVRFIRTGDKSQGHAIVESIHLTESGAH